MRATVIKWLRARHERALATETAAGVTLGRSKSRVGSIHESLYENRVSFIKRAARKVGLGKVHVSPQELTRFTSVQAAQAGQTLARNPSRTAQ